MVTVAGQVSTFAGSGPASSTPVESGSAFANGHASSATFNMPHGITVDSSDNIYVADWYFHRIRMITQARVVSTVAGSGAAGNADGPASSAQFNCPSGVAVNNAGIVYMSSNYAHVVKKIENGQVTTIAGTGAAGSADGAATTASLNYPYDVEMGFDGNLYIADYGNNRIRMLALSGVAKVSTVAGWTGGWADGVNTYAMFNAPIKIDFDSSRSLYVSEYGGNRIRKVSFCHSSAVFDSTLKACTCNVGFQLLSNGSCIQCPVGTESSSDKSQCIACGVGKYRSLSMSSCALCSADLWPNSDSSPCMCSTGKYLFGGMCIDCPVGKETNSTRTGCNDCSSGKFRPRSTFTECVDCPLYATCNSTAISSCQSGFKMNSLGLACEQCPIGTQSSADSKSCVSCASNFFQSSLSQAVCQTCPLNAVCTSTGFTCNAGFEPCLDGLGCSQCLEGYAKAAAGNSSCNPCSLGQESAANKQSCSACSADKFRPNLILNKCVPCLAAKVYKRLESQRQWRWMRSVPDRPGFQRHYLFGMSKWLLEARSIV